MKKLLFIIGLSFVMIFGTINLTANAAEENSNSEDDEVELMKVECSGSKKVDETFSATDNNFTLEEDFLNEPQLPQSSSSGNSNWVDGEWWYNILVDSKTREPSLPHPVDYSDSDLLKYVKRGDLVYEDTGAAGITGHSAIVYDVFYDWYYGQEFIVIIEAVSDGVCYGLMTPKRFIKKEVEIYRLMNASESQIDGAIQFAKSQIGKDYGISSGRHADSSKKHWYCSELVWASFYLQGIDLDSKPYDAFIMPRTIRDYKHANLIMHYEHSTSVTAINFSNHIIKCNSIETIFLHEYIDNNCCSIKCKVCNYIFYTQSHIYTDKYTSVDSTNHYAYCRCGSRILKSHSFYTENGSNTCSQCGYKISENHTHKYTYKPLKNTSSHTASCSCGDSKIESCFGQMMIGQTVTTCVKCGRILKS